MACAVAGLACSEPARAAVYSPQSYFLTGSLSFRVLNASEINEKSHNIAPLPGLIGGHLHFERGLVGPSWSHWVELAYFFGSASAVDAVEGTSATYNQSLSHLAVFPIGVTYWFGRTAYIDFGVSVGAGLALSPSYTFSTTTAAGATTEEAYKGNTGLAFAVRGDARFWFGQYWGATFSAGLHAHSTSFQGDGLTPVNGNLTGMSVVGGVTYAFGGVRGTGRSFVEVIRDRPDPKPKQAPSARQPVAPRRPGPTPPPPTTPR